MGCKDGREEEVIVAFELGCPHYVSGVHLISETRFNAASLSVSLKLFKIAFNYQCTLKYTAKLLLLRYINMT